MKETKIKKTITVDVDHMAVSLILTLLRQAQRTWQGDAKRIIKTVAAYYDMVVS